MAQEDIGLVCRRCNEATSLASSHATGRNELLRICQDCSACDRAMTRQCNQHKELINKRKTKELTAVEEEALQKCESSVEMKKKLAKMSEAERHAFYQAEKKSRGSGQPGGRKRTFASAVGTIEETREQKRGQHEVDMWWTCKNWVAREMQLGLAKNFEDGCKRFEAECAKDNAETKVSRGETLLREFNGEVGKLGEERNLRGTVRQRRDINDASELAAYHEVSGQRLSAGSKKLATEKAMQDGGYTGPVAPALNIARDLDERKQARGGCRSCWKSRQKMLRRRRQPRRGQKCQRQFCL